MNGLLIMFDGPDGVGKTTQFDLVVQQLQGEGLKLFTTHMLGGTAISETMKQVMFSDLPRPAATNLHLSLAMYYSLAEVVQQKRAEGYHVLIDRSPLSLIAYQVYGDGLDLATGLRACQEALQTFQPDKVLIYEASSEILLGRRHEQQAIKASDYFDKQLQTYHERTTEGYRVAAKHYNVTVIPADGDIASIHRQTMEKLRPLLLT